MDTKHKRTNCRTFSDTPGMWQSGFTLIELMIVVVVIAILAAVAYPSYISSVVKTKRAAAEGCVTQYSTAMERFYTANLRYDQDIAAGAANPAVGSPPALTLDCASNQNSGADYDFAIVATAPDAAVNPNTYTVTATPKGAQASRDTLCGALSIDQAGTRTVSGSGGLAKCW